MKYTACEVCTRKDVPINASQKIDGIVYCNSCLEKDFPNEVSLFDKTVVKGCDPTICASCNIDFAGLELKKILASPICEDCEIKLEKKIFPPWVKGFFLGILAIVIIGFAWNWRFYEAYKKFQSANEYFVSGDFTNATALMSAASSKIPEADDIKTLSVYFHGMELLSNDKSESALDEFNKCKDKLPPEFNISRLIIKARAGASFDRNDYQSFLEASKESLVFDSTSAISLTSVASAYACVYADEGNEEAKKSAIHYLQEAKNIDDTSSELKGYYNMVEYRIESKRIIKREEFIKQFPNGWTKN